MRIYPLIVWASILGNHLPNYDLVLNFHDFIRFYGSPYNGADWVASVAGDKGCRYRFLSNEFHNPV